MKRLMVLTATTILQLGWMGCSGTPENETPPPETSSNPIEPEGSFSTYGNPADRMGIQLANIAEAIENVEDEASVRAAAQEIAKRPRGSLEVFGRYVVLRSVPPLLSNTQNRRR